MIMQIFCYIKVCKFSVVQKSFVIITEMSRAPKKRLFEKLSDIEEAEKRADLDAVIQSISPMKSSNTGHGYYVGTISDDTKTLRMVGFDDKTQAKLAAANTAQSTVHLSNCEISKSSYTDGGLEVIVRKTTNIEPSPKKIKFQIPVRETQKEVNIAEISGLEVGTVVSLRCKVLTVSPARVVSTGRLQHATLADDTGTITLCCWDRNIDCVLESTWYSFTNLSISSFRDEKTLTLKMSSSVSEVTRHVDDNTVKVVEENDSVEVLNNAAIIGTQHFNLHFSCVNCSNKLTAMDSMYSRCTKCDTLQALADCQFEVSANLLFVAGDDKKMLKACTQIILRLVGAGVSFNNETECQLLGLKDMKVTYTSKDHYIKTIDLECSNPLV